MTLLGSPAALTNERFDDLGNASLVLGAKPGGVQSVVDPFISALAVRQRTIGLSGAWQAHPRFSVGATVRYQRFRELADTGPLAGILLYSDEPRQIDPDGGSLQ